MSLKFPEFSRLWCAVAFVAALVLVEFVIVGLACAQVESDARQQRCLEDCCGSSSCLCRPDFMTAAADQLRVITYATVCTYDRCLLDAIRLTNCHLAPQYSTLYLQTLEKKSTCDNEVTRLGCDHASFGVFHHCFASLSACGPQNTCTSQCYSEKVKCLANAGCVPTGVSTLLELCRRSLYEDALLCDACSMPLPHPSSENESGLVTFPPTCGPHFARCESAMKLLPVGFTVDSRLSTPSPNASQSGSSGNGDTLFFIIGGAAAGSLLMCGIVAVLVQAMKRHRIGGGHAAANVVGGSAGAEQNALYHVRRHSGAGRGSPGSSKSQSRPSKAWSSVHEGDTAVQRVHIATVATADGDAEGNRPTRSPGSKAFAAKDQLLLHTSVLPVGDVGVEPDVPATDDAVVVVAGRGSSFTSRGRRHARTGSDNSGMNASLNELDLNLSAASDASIAAAGSTIRVSPKHYSLRGIRRRRCVEDAESESAKDPESEDDCECGAGCHVPEAPFVRSLTATPTVMLPKDIVRHIRMNAYRRGRLLGKGIDGVVTEVVLPNGFAVAVKEVLMLGKTAAEIQDHAFSFKPLLKLDHPNVCRMHMLSFDEQAFCLQFWMEKVSGGSLDKLAMKREAPLPESVVAEFTAQIIDGLTYLHMNCIVHRDISGKNLLWDAEHRLVKIADLGSASLINGRAAPPRLLVPSPQSTDGEGGEPGTVAGEQSPKPAPPAAAGSVLWMAPELFTPTKTTPTFANDVFSLGITVAELLCKGRPPWPEECFANPWSAMFHIASMNVQPTMPGGASIPLQDFLRRCWEHDPARRATTAELRGHEWIRRLASHVPQRFSNSAAAREPIPRTVPESSAVTGKRRDAGGGGREDDEEPRGDMNVEDV